MENKEVNETSLDDTLKDKILELQKEKKTEAKLYRMLQKTREGVHKGDPNGSFDWQPLFVDWTKHFRKVEELKIECKDLSNKRLDLIQ